MRNHMKSHMRRMRKMKLKLVRKKSGKKIRSEIRQQELHPTKKIILPDGTTYTQQLWKRHENQGLYKRNNPVKRHVENPNLYEGETFKGGGTLRTPKKCRKTAWKRFNKIQNQRQERLRAKYWDVNAPLTEAQKLLL